MSSLRSRAVTLLLVALLLAPPLAAQTDDASCESEDLVVAFGNGMFNELYDAYQSMLVLKSRVEPIVEDDYETTFVLSYNDSEPWYEQAFEVITQRGVERWGTILQQIQRSDGPEWLQSLVRSLQAEATEQTWVQDADLQLHVQRYRNNILEGKKVMVAAHSQGNFYANAAYDMVDSPSFGIVSAATPAPEVRGNGPYVTLTQDEVMNFVRATSPSTLAANVTNATTTSSGHEFVTDYLDGSPSGGILLNHYRLQISAIEAPEAEAGAGILTVTLAWGAEPDVDLHVFEPDGTHVYYANSSGTSGFLDVDDTSGFGPEHYYASCERLQTGTYRIGVNYYDGDGPETARVQVDADDEVRSYTQPLGSDRGSDGDDSPIPVATVEVTGSREDGFEFEIRGGGAALRDPGVNGVAKVLAAR